MLSPFTLFPASWQAIKHETTYDCDSWPFLIFFLLLSVALLKLWQDNKQKSEHIVLNNELTSQPATTKPEKSSYPNMLVSALIIPQDH